MTFSLAYDPELLRMNFLDLADLRRQDATIGSRKNDFIQAANLLEKLATTVDAVKPEIFDAYAELFGDYYDGEAHGEMLREIGFSSWPDTATEFVQNYIASRTGG
jgi:hypothetical protein